MALGISIVGEVESRGFLRRRPSPAKLRRWLAETVARAMPDPLQRRFLRFGEIESGMEITLHPAGEPLYVFFEDDGIVSLSAKTSTVGPGYHAMVVDLIEAVGAEGLIAWDNACHEDDTGYFENPDFRLLQEGMAGFLQSLGSAVLDVDADPGMGISVPEGYRVRTEKFAYSPLGFWDRDWFERASMAEGHGLLAMASDFFPWWNHTTDADYWTKGGLVIAWLTLPWTAPENTGEEELYRLVLDCWDRARHQDATAPVPDDACQEIRSLLDQPASAPTPQALGIGFRKRLMKRPLIGDWTVDLPGYFSQDEDTDDETAIYFHDSLVVRGSGLVVSRQDAEDDGVVEFIRDWANENGGPGSTYSFQCDDLEGWGFEERSENGEFWNFHAQVASGNRICIMTISYDDPDVDREWAVDVFESARITEYSDPD